MRDTFIYPLLEYQENKIRVLIKINSALFKHGQPSGWKEVTLHSRYRILSYEELLWQNSAVIKVLIIWTRLKSKLQRLQKESSATLEIVSGVIDSRNWYSFHTELLLSQPARL